MSSDQQPTNLVTAIQDVTEKASLLVREEIELAKAEVTDKVTGSSARARPSRPPPGSLCSVPRS